MKILICVHSFKNGGAERVASLWINGFSMRGNHVKVLTCGEEVENDYDIPNEVEIVNINPGGNFAKRNLARFFQIRRMLKSYAPDVIILVQHPWIWWVTFAKLGLRIPVINTEHNTFERPESAPMPKKAYFEKFILNRFFSGVTVLTDADKKIIGKRLRKVYVMPNPLAFEPLKELKPRGNIMLAMGRLDAGHYKGFDLLIKAFGIAHTGDWVLQIAGTGSERNIEKYKILAKDCGVGSQIKFLGYVKNPVELFQEASIFVLSSRYEGFGLVLIEAMSQGCACIACDYKGRQSEMILDETMGQVCPTEDVEALAACMKKLMHDEKYREAMRKNAIERSIAYSLDNISTLPLP